MRTAPEAVKDLESDAKAENARLIQENELLQVRAEGIRLNATQYAESQRTAIRQEMNKLTEAKKEFDSQKAEFTKVLNEFKQNKTAFEKERQAAIDTKANYEKMNEKAGAFILLVKREAAKL